MQNFGISSCFHCGGTDIITDYEQGDVICRGCGEIVGDRIIDDTPDWRLASKDDGFDAEAYARCSRLRMDDTSSTILVGCSNEVSKVQYKMNNTRNDAKLVSYLISLREYGSKLTLTSSTVDKASELLQLAFARRTFLSVQKSCMIAALCYIACRMEGFPRTLQEISSVLVIDKVDIGRMSTSLISLLNIESAVRRIRPEQLLERMISQLKLSFKIADLSRDTCRKLNSLQLLESCAPSIVASAVILFVYGATLYPKLVSKGFIQSLSVLSQSSTTTIIKAHSELLKVKNEVLPDALKNRSQVKTSSSSASSNISSVALSADNPTNTTGKPTISEDSQISV